MSNKAREMSLLKNLRFHSVLKSSSVSVIKNLLFDPIFVCALYFYANYNIAPNLARHADFSGFRRIPENKLMKFHDG